MLSLSRNEDAPACSQAQPRATGSSRGAVKRPNGTSTERLPLVDRSRWPKALDGDASRSAQRLAEGGRGSLAACVCEHTHTYDIIFIHMCIGLSVYYILPVYKLYIHTCMHLHTYKHINTYPSTYKYLHKEACMCAR